MTSKAMKQLPVLDEQAIAELERGLPGGNLGAALETFANELEKRDVEIRHRLAEGDYDALVSIAHGLKGSAATFCAPALAHAAVLLEERLPGGDAGLIDASSRSLSEEAVLVARHVRDYLLRKRGARP